MLFNREDFKMHILKQMLNYVASQALSVTGNVKSNCPQSKLVESVWSRLMDVLKKEAKLGVQTDGNFEKILKMTKNCLIYLCEKDNYYRRWLGLTVLFLKEELEKQMESFDLKQAMERVPTLEPLTIEEFNMHKNALFEISLCGYLYTLHRANNLNTSSSILDLKGGDSEVTIRLYLKDGMHYSYKVVFGGNYAYEKTFKT